MNSGIKRIIMHPALCVGYRSGFLFTFGISMYRNHYNNSLSLDCKKLRGGENGTQNFYFL